VFTDNYYLSPAYLNHYWELEYGQQEHCAQTMLGSQAGVVTLKAVLEKKADHGTGYHVRTSSTKYVCWKDVRVVTLISTAYLGHSEGTVSRRTSEGKLLYRYLFQLLDTIRQWGESIGMINT